MSELKCNTDTIRNQVVPTLESCCSDLEDASSTVSGLPSLEGCEEIGSIAGEIDAIKSMISEAKASILEAASYAEQKEKENLGIIDWIGSLFNKWFKKTNEEDNSSSNEEVSNVTNKKFGTLFDMLPSENNELRNTMMTNNLIEALAKKYGVETTITTKRDEKISEMPLYDQRYNTEYSAVCGPTSFAMLASYATGKELTPDMIVKMFPQFVSAYKQGEGTGDSVIQNKEILDEVNLQLEGNYYWGEAWGEGKLIEALEKGCIAIWRTSNHNFTQSGHYLAIKGLTEDGNIIINDPYGGNYESKNPVLVNGFENGFDPKQLSSFGGNFYVYSIKDSSVIETTTETTINRPISTILKEINKKAQGTADADLVENLVGSLAENIKTITQSNQSSNSNLTNNSVSTRLFDKNITFDVQYYKLDGYIKGYSIGLPSTMNTDNQPKNIIVYLHGLGDATFGQEKFNTSGIMGAISNSELMNPNAIIITPQLSTTKDSAWCGPTPEKELANLLDNILNEYNLNREDVNITLMGNSSGGQGTVWMANKLESYFDKVVVMDGANSIVQPSDVNQPMIGYASTQSGGNHYKYMTGNLANSIGEENVFIVESSHGELQNNAYNIDANNNGISDMLEFAFSFDSNSQNDQNQNDENVTDVNLNNLNEESEKNNSNVFGSLFELFPGNNSLANHLINQRVLESLAEKYGVETENGNIKKPTSVILHEIKEKASGITEQNLVTALEQAIKEKLEVNYNKIITNIQPKNNSDIAHRGYTPGGIYDNSAEGFILAGEKGFWGCETDVRFDSDGNLVCSHNAVKNGENPTSFEEYLDICKEYGMTAIIDLKYEKGVGPADANLSPAILKTIQEKGMLDSCILQTNNPTDIPYIRENSEDARIWYLTDVISDKNLQLIEENNIECVNIQNNSEKNAYRIRKLTENGIDVCVWNVQAETTKERLLDMGVKYIMSDNVLGITPYQEGEEDFNKIKDNSNSNTQLDKTVNTQNSNTPTNTQVEIDNNPGVIESKPSSVTTGSSNSTQTTVTPNNSGKLEKPIVKGNPEAILKAAKNTEKTTSHSEYIGNILHDAEYLTEEEMNLYKDYSIEEISEKFEGFGWEKITDINKLEAGDIIIISNNEEETIQIYAGDNEWYTIDENEPQQMGENWTENTKWYAYRPSK